MLQTPEKTVGKTAHKHKADQQEHIEEIIAPRHRLFPLYPEKLDAQTVAYRRDTAGNHNILQLRLPGKSPQAVIHPEQIQHKKSDQNINHQKMIDRLNKMRRYLRYIEIITHEQRQIARPDHTDNIINDQTGSSVQQLNVKRLFYIF